MEAYFLIFWLSWLPRMLGLTVVDLGLDTVAFSNSPPPRAATSPVISMFDLSNLALRSLGLYVWGGYVSLACSNLLHHLQEQSK